MLANYTPIAAEQALFDSLQTKLGGVKKDQLEALFSEDDRYQPVLTNTPELAEALEVFRRYFPDSRIPEELSVGKAGWLKKLFPGKEDAGKQAEADLDSLCECYKQHLMDAVKEFGEDRLLCNVYHIDATDEEGGVMLFPCGLHGISSG